MAQNTPLLNRKGKSSRAPRRISVSPRTGSLRSKTMPTCSLHMGNTGTANSFILFIEFTYPPFRACSFFDVKVKNCTVQWRELHLKNEEALATRARIEPVGLCSLSRSVAEIEQYFIFMPLCLFIICFPLQISFQSDASRKRPTSPRQNLPYTPPILNIRLSCNPNLSTVGLSSSTNFLSVRLYL
jgi:hypothetical protein